MTDDQGSHDWRFLLDIFYHLGRLDHPLYRALAHDDYPREYRLLAIESVLRSGKVPVQGCRHTSLGLEAAERIEMKIDAETEIDITVNEITLRHGYGIPGADGIEIARFKRARADLASVEQCLRENILRADHVVDEPKLAGYEAADDVETECSTWLTTLPEHPRLKKTQALERFNQLRCEANAKTIGARSFLRLWKKSAHSSWHARGRLPGT